MKLHLRHILNPVFLLSLFLLLLNDFVLKAYYHSWFTGKLSDVAGIIVLAQLFHFLVKEKWKLPAYFAAALCFACWKSAYSQPLIDSLNNLLAGLHAGRTVDYTDLLCCFVLVPLYFYEPEEIRLGFKPQLLSWPLLAITVFAICATSRARTFNGNYIFVHEIFKLKVSRAGLLKQLDKEQITYQRRDSVYIFAGDTFDCYELHNIRIAPDTVYAAFIGIHDLRKKTEVYINSLYLSKDPYAYHHMDFKAHKRWEKDHRLKAKSYFKKLDD